MRHYLHIIWHVVYIFSAICFGCTEDSSSPINTRIVSSHLRIVIKWPGDDMADRQELELRDHIAQRIVNENIGKIVRSGTGMGWMDIVVAVENSESNRSIIEQIIKEIMPNSGYTIQIGNT